MQLPLTIGYSVALTKLDSCDQWSAYLQQQATALLHSMVICVHCWILAVV